jgi:diguanylate cyclase (GGDEF)-like protein/PAS domain S-box-containing protein
LTGLEAGAGPAGRAAADLAVILDGVSRSLAEATTDYRDVIDLVVRTAGVVLSGSAVMWLVGEQSGHPDVASVWVPDRDQRQVLTDALRARQLPVDGLPVADVLRTGEPVIEDDLASDFLLRGIPPERLANVHVPRRVAVAAVPLRARGRTLGALSIYRPGSPDAFGDADVVLLQQLADRAALAIDNARLLDAAEREIAERGRVEGELLASEERLHAIARAAPVLLFACDREGRLTVVDGGLTDDLAGLPISIGQSMLEAFAEYPDLVAEVRRGLAGETLSRVRLPFPGYELEAYAGPLSSPSGEPAGFAGIVVDVSERIAAEAAVSETSRRLAALVESASDVIAVLTPDGQVHYVNEAVEQVFGRRWVAGDFVEVFMLMHPDDRERVRDHVRAAIRHPGTSPPIEFRIRHADGSWRTVESVGNNMLDDSAIHGFVVTIRDVTARRAAEERSLLQAQRQEHLTTLGHLALARLDMAGVEADAIDLLASQLGADCAHMLEVMPGAEFLVLRASRGHPGAAEGVVLVSTDPTASPASMAISCGEPVACEDLALETRFDVPALWADAGCASFLEVPIPGQDEAVGVIGVAHRLGRVYESDDIRFVQAIANILAAATARHRAEETIRDQARRDQLTGLPNRLALVEHLDRLLGASTERPLAGGLLVLDIDGFKEINDTLGQQVGDRVLLEAADRFRRLGEQIDVVARLGGDEFAVYSSVVRTTDGAEAMARRLLSTLGEPIEVGGVRLRLRGSVGVVDGGASPHGGDANAVPMLRRAEAAMYRAKRRASGYSRWTPDLDQSSLSKLSLAGELGEALDGHELSLVYQPKFACRSERPSGVEALVRWRHPVRGMVLPDAFVPLAEQTGMIKPLTAWVLGEALRQRAKWSGRFDKLSMAVNLSASTLHDPELFEAVGTALALSGAPPESVELEITESAVMHDPERALAAVTELTKIGVRFAIDDFGTGYSSLAYLQRLPVALVKVDKSFVVPLLEEGPARSIVRAVIDLAHSLGISVAAEGVESAEVARVLGDLGCDELQGYHIGRPMTAPAVTAWLDDRFTGAPAAHLAEVRP